MRFNQTVRDDKKLNDDNHAFFKNCVRFTKHKMLDQDVANVYVNLRQKGCDRASAIQYCVQQHCKVDITAPKFGPSNNKQLKAVVDPINLYYGWQIAGTVKYQLDEQHSHYNQIIGNQDDLGLNKVFSEDQNLNTEYRLKMKHLKEFYIELNKKYSFSEMSLKQLYTKLKEMEEEAIRKDNQPKSFLKGRGVKFFEIVDIINQEDECSIKGNRIVDLKAFKSILSEQEKNQFQVKQKFLDHAFYDNINQEVQESVERRNSVLQQLSKKYLQEANSSVKDLHESTIQAHELYKEEYNQSRYVTVPRKSKDNPMKELLRANTVHLKKNKILKAMYEDTIPESDQDDEKRPSITIQKISRQNNKFQFSPNSSNTMNENEKKRHDRIQLIRASQLQQHRVPIKLDMSTNLIQKGYLEFEKKLDDLAHDELHKILHPLKKAPRKIKPPQPIKRFSLFHQQSFDEEMKPIVKSQNSSLNQLASRMSEEKNRFLNSAFGEPRARSYSAKKRYQIKLLQNPKRKKQVELQKKETIKEDFVEQASNPDRDTPNLFKRVLKNYPDNEKKAFKVVEQLKNRKKRQKEMLQSD